MSKLEMFWLFRTIKGLLDCRDQDYALREIKAIVKDTIQEIKADTSEDSEEED